MPWVRDYFGGYSAAMPHPFETSTGSEGRCDICGGPGRSREHDKPWTRTGPEYVWQEPVEIQMLMVVPTPPPNPNVGRGALEFG